jgi:hypothetical protein
MSVSDGKVRAMLWKTFRVPIILTVILLALTLWLGGGGALFIVMVLAVLEISLSFDNAVVNARILGRMNEFWQKIFLTVGIAIAVFGMRLIFPVAIVGLMAHLNWVEVVNLALNSPDTYQKDLVAAHPAIAAFGGMFLLMLFLEFFLEDRPTKWLLRIETALAKIGRLKNVPTIIALLVLVLISTFIAGDHAVSVLVSGLSGIMVYLIVASLVDLAETMQSSMAKAGLFTFIQLEVLDGSFSFDGVVSAFAITNQIFLITLGLGIGALYIRSLTVYLVHQRSLAKYIFLEHGAHYALGALALLLLITIKYEVPEAVTGLIGIGFIGMSFWASRQYRKAHPELASKI